MHAYHVMANFPQMMFVGAYGKHSFQMAVEIVENRSIVLSNLTTEQFKKKKKKKKRRSMGFTGFLANTESL